LGFRCAYREDERELERVMIVFRLVLLEVRVVELEVRPPAIFANWSWVSSLLGFAIFLVWCGGLCLLGGRTGALDQRLPAAAAGGARGRTGGASAGDLRQLGWGQLSVALCHSVTLPFVVVGGPGDYRLEEREDDFHTCWTGGRRLLLEVRPELLEVAPPAIFSNCSGVSSLLGLLMVTCLSVFVLFLLCFDCRCLQQQCLALCERASSTGCAKASSRVASLLFKPLRPTNWITFSRTPARERRPPKYLTIR
jgi:hypothetical protein